MEKQKARASIEAIGIIPALRLSSAEDARFAAEAVSGAGIPIVEITMTVPGAIEVISDLARHAPHLMVGFAVKQDVVVLPGALTPTEVMMAWKAGPDFVKIFPCSQVGGAGYIKALKKPFPHVPLIAAGGVNQQTASDFILAGAIAIGVGKDLIPLEAIQRRQSHRIQELAHRFLSMVKAARSLKAGTT